MLLENLRFHAEEEKNDAGFAKGLAALCDVYVNDAFGAAHRAHASVEALVRLVPEAGAGLLMEKELRYLGAALEHPERPFVAVLGGAKVSDKIEVIENLIPRVDRLLIGGAMAYTFFKSMGKPVGKSLVEDDKLDSARDILARCEGSRTPAAAAAGSRRRAASRRGRSGRNTRRRRPSHRRPDGSRHRAEDRSRPIRRARRREDGGVERADGRLRDLRRSRPGRWQLAQAVARRERHDDRGWRRLDCGDQEVGRSCPDHAHFDRRRRLARVSRRTDAAGSCCASGRLDS